MSVTLNENVEDVGLFVPFRGFDREVGPVGTLHCFQTVFGDGSGGTVAILLRMKRVEFGFHPIWVLTRVHTLDQLATPEVVRMSYSASGNERLSFGMNENILSAAGPPTSSSVNFRHLQVPIEPSEEAVSQVLSARWSTNTNALTYEFSVFGMLYDAEAMARGKEKGRAADPLLGGIR